MVKQIEPLFKAIDPQPEDCTMEGVYHLQSKYLAAQEQHLFYETYVTRSILWHIHRQFLSKTELSPQEEEVLDNLGLFFIRHNIDEECVANPELLDREKAECNLYFLSIIASPVYR